MAFKNWNLGLISADALILFDFLMCFLVDPLFSAAFGVFLAYFIQDSNLELISAVLLIFSGYFLVDLLFSPEFGVLRDFLPNSWKNSLQCRS